MKIPGVTSALKSLASAVAGSGDFATGVAAQGFNNLSRDVAAIRDGDFFVVQSPAMQAGADMIRHPRFPKVEPVDFTARRDERPLLARHRIDVPDAEAGVRLLLDARAPGADWSVKGREAAPLSVYVDGRYHSDVLVMSERKPTYNINLSGLAPGSHDVEVRAAKDLVPGLDPKVTRLDHRITKGEQAHIDRYAPILETRHNPNRPADKPLFVDSDVPLVMIPEVKKLGDGARKIEYHLMVSNEDGGTPIEDTYRRFGRAVDYEPVYSVTINRDGKRIDDAFQGPSHVPYRFAGTRVGDRPVLRVASPNNQFTSRLLNATPRWSEAPVGRDRVAPSDRELMLRHPWTFAVMGKEQLREGKVAPLHGPAGPNQVPDARRYLYFERDAARQAMESQKAIDVVLADGSRASVPTPKKDRFPTMFNRPEIGTAIPLPPEISPEQISQIRLPEGRVVVLDSKFRPRRVPTAPAAAATTP